MAVSSSWTAYSSQIERPTKTPLLTIDTCSSPSLGSARASEWHRANHVIIFRIVKSTFLGHTLADDGITMEKSLTFAIALRKHKSAVDFAGPFPRVIHTASFVTVSR